MGLLEVDLGPFPFLTGGRTSGVRFEVPVDARRADNCELTMEEDMACHNGGRRSVQITRRDKNERSLAGAQSLAVLAQGFSWSS